MPRGRVKNTHETKKEVTNNKTPSGASIKLTFDFSYPNWLSGVRLRDFTNMLKDPHEFAESIVHILNKLIPVVSDNWDSIKFKTNYQFQHCHRVPDDKLPLVKQIEQEIHGKSLLDPDAEHSVKYWQIGIEGIRMFALYNYDSNIMFPIFIDYHHLIYPDKNYNQRDTDHFSFCPISEYC
ncbi:hypothetical protein [Paenibacillus sp. GCM10012306]|uniref:hypothetical protein n=1 Tax=Paenibacillus sp. GCM10012306 TaxID=3317342 RepID=UPI00360CE6CD